MTCHEVLVTHSQWFRIDFCCFYFSDGSALRLSQNQHRSLVVFFDQDEHCGIVRQHLQDVDVLAKAVQAI